MSDNLEKLFKKALDEVTVEPPARVWEGVNAHFNRKRQRKLFLYSGVAAAIALLLAISLFLENSVSEGYVSPTPLASNINTIKLENNSLVHIISTSNRIPSFKHSTNKKNIKISPLAKNQSITLALAGNEVSSDLMNSRIQDLSIPIVNGNALENQKKYIDLLHLYPTESTYAARDKEEEKIQETPKPQKIRNKEKNSFSVGGYVSPGYTSGSYHQSNANSRTTQFSDDQMSGLFNVTGGITFAVKPNKRISIETGVGYSRMGQKTDEMQVYSPQLAMSTSGNKQLLASNVQVATPLGSVKSKATAAVYSMDANIALKDSQTPEGSIEQQFDAIEVPLLFRYRLNNNRVKFSVLGGFGASFMVRNETYLEYEGTRESMGQTDDIRKFNISTNFGIGLEYPITKSIHFRIEPGFKYYLQSLSKNSDIEFKPYTFTFSTGIGINF